MKVDTLRIKKYLMDILEDTREIEILLREKDNSQIIKENITKYALKYLTIEISEAMANVLQHILAKHFGTAVKGYLDTIKKAHEKEILSEQLFKQLKPFFDFRNSLIHRYWIIDDETFIKNLREGYRNFFDFCNEIEKYLENISES